MSTTDFTPNGVQLSGYDTVISLPQYYINYSLQNLLLNGATPDGQSLQNISLELTAGDMFLQGTVSALKVALYIPQQPGSLIFTITFSSGQFDYWDITTSPPTKLQQDITNLTWGLQVNMSKLDVGISVVPASLQPQVQAASDIITSGGTSGVTIQQLFMDFDDADVDNYDPGTTVWPTTASASAIASFGQYAKVYLINVKKANGNVLGYSVAATSAEPSTNADPTFPPTSVVYATNQYIPYTSPAPADLNPDYDTLNYNMMVNGNAYPNHLPPVWMGNFVAPTADNPVYYGTMSLSQDLLMNKWLGPALAPVLATCLSLSDTTSDTSPVATTSVGQFSPSGLGLTYSASSSSKSHKTNTFSNDDCVYSINTTVNVVPNIGPSNPSITVTKTTNWSMDFTHWYGVDGAAAKSEQTVSFSCTLTVNITFLGCKDGAIQISVTSVSEPQPQDGNLYGDPYGWLITGVTGSLPGFISAPWTLDADSDQFGALATGVGIPDQITTKLQQALPAFVVPGGGDLFLGNPWINAEGDLMIGLSFKS